MQMSPESQDDEELAPVNPSGVKLGEEITLDELLPYFKSFYRTKPYVSIIGGLCTQGKTKGDIDIFIRSAHRDLATEFRIIRSFPEKYWFRFHFHYLDDQDSHLGVFTNFMDIYNEKIEVISGPKLELMSRDFKKGDSHPLDPRYDVGIEEDKKCTKIELFKFCPLLKPAHGRYKGEEYSIDALMEVVNAKPEWYEKGTYIQKKFDGVHVRCDVQRHYESGYDVIIYSEEGNEITKNLPTLRKELGEASKGHAISVVGELEFWEDKKHQSRQQTTAIIHTKEVHLDESKVILNTFDTLFHDKDIHNEPHSERLKSHAKIKDTAHIKKADYKLVHSPTELHKAVQHYAGLPGSEGAYLKRADFPYELDGKSLLNLKYKNTFSIDAKVVDVHDVKDANAFNYLCVIEDDKGNDVPIGRTYNTSIKVSPGAALKVEFVNLSQYTDPETKKVWFNWWSPHVIMAREDKRKPDNTLTAEKLVVASKGTVTEKPWPKRYKDDDSTDGKSGQDAEGYIKSPSEDKKWLGMIQFDSRKKNVGIDFRWQVSDSTIAAFTVFVPKGLSKVPENPADAKKILMKEILPMVKENIADPSKKFNCQPKKNISATKDVFEKMIGYGPGYDKKRFMWTVDNFEVEHGCKKLDYVELFCENDFISGRIVFVKIPNKAEWKKTPEGDYTWMMFKTKTETPYVLSTRAVDKKWIPPYGASALPRNLRSKIPERFQYWKKKDEKMRLELRDELVEEIKKKLLLKLDAIKKGKIKA